MSTRYCLQVEKLVRSLVDDVLRILLLYSTILLLIINNDYYLYERGGPLMDRNDDTSRVTVLTLANGYFNYYHDRFRFY